MCLTHTILDEPDISKPSSSGSSDTLMIVSLPTPPYRTGCRQRVVLHCMPHNTSIASDAPTRKNTYPVGNILALGSSRDLRTDEATGAGVAHTGQDKFQLIYAARSFRNVLSDNNTAVCLARAEHTCKQKTWAIPHGASGL